jgi:hypothetical protein
MPSTLTTTLLGLAGILLGLAILVQVIQECWKYLLNTKAAAYQRAMFAYLGPWARELTRPGVLPDLQVDGPLQVWRRRPKGRLLPMDQQTLVAALERTAAPWIRRVLQTLRAEAELQSGKAQSLSPAFDTLVEQLRVTVRGSPGYASAQDILRFFDQWSLKPGKPNPEGVDATKLVNAFREQFLPQVAEAERNFAQLDRNFEHVYRRRNTALTLLFALGVVLVLDMPIGAVYRQSKAMTPEQAVTLAEAARGVYDSLNQLSTVDSAKQRTDSARAQEYLRFSNDILSSLRQSANLGPGPSATTSNYISARTSQLWGQLRAGGVGGSLGYLLECLVTALLISFGAPFWNDLAGAVLRVSKGSAKLRVAPDQPEGGA